MNRENLITENLAIGILETEKKLLYGIINTANYAVMGYSFIAGDTSDCLESVGCFPEDVEAADLMEVGGTMYAEWPAERAVIIIKLKDSR